MALVLLHWGEAVLEHHGHGFAVLHRPGAAEVQQLQAAVRHPHDVVRGDVPVDHLFLVEPPDIVQQVLQRRQQRFRRNALARLGVHQAVQGRAVQVFHHQVGGVVGLQVGQGLDHRGHPLQAGEYPGLLDKAVASALVGLLHAGQGHHRNAVLPAFGAPGGEVLLHGHPAALRLVPAGVGHAEAALAQRRADLIAVAWGEPGPAQNGAHRKQKGRFFPVEAAAAAGAALPVLTRRHAAGAQRRMPCGHVRLPPLPVITKPSFSDPR